MNSATAHHPAIAPATAGATMATSATPDTLNDPADSALWAEVENANRRIGLLRTAADLDDQALARALRNTCVAGWGMWLSPVATVPGHRPPSHQYEVDLFGVYAVGATPTECARAWRIASLNLQGDAP